MPGELAGLFAGEQAPPAPIAGSQQPASLSIPSSLAEVQEQLRALSDAKTVVQGDSESTLRAACLGRAGHTTWLVAGLRNLNQRLQEGGVAEFVLHSTGTSELRNIWDNQKLVITTNFGSTSAC